MLEEDKVVLTREELRALAADVVDDTLVKLGIDPADHKRTQEDMIYLRKLRLVHESVGKHKVILGLGLMFTLAVTLLTLGLKSWITTLIAGNTP